jgi:uncharacterized alpha-E superfamily protein
MISRVADHCYWFGRYVERTESIARLLAATQHLALDAEVPSTACWGPVILVAGEGVRFVGLFGESALGDGALVRRYMVWEESNLVSLLSSFALARENARSIRDVLSLEVWEAVNELHWWLASSEARSLSVDDAFAFFTRVQRGAQLILGLLRSTMLHDVPLDFTWLGVLLERTDQTARMLDVHHHTLGALTRSEGGAPDPLAEIALWLSLLRSRSGFEPFVKVNRGRVTADLVARFLIFERRFPRSVAYCVRSALSRLEDIRPPSEPSLPGAEAWSRLSRLDAWLSGCADSELPPAQIHDLLVRVVDEVGATSEAMARELLGYA